MLSVALTWLIIFIASLVFGRMSVRIIYRNSREALWKLDVYLVFGLMILNVYAQIFSLFYKVGEAACLILFVIVIISLAIMLIFDVQKKENLFKQFNSSYFVKNKWCILFIGVCAAATVFWTINVPSHYDTYLYHIQAIRWIEEYGVVPGLGNLHFRFAYNSAFMPLQALFSLEWLTGRSLHTVNGYICCLALAYALADNHLLKQEKLAFSDLLKLVMVIYVYQNREYISSPNSDILTMLLTMYICVKWSEFIERDVKDTLSYTFLCVLGVWAVTVKLSAGVCIILAIYPLVLLIKRKQWKEISVNICIGLIVALPWLVRNVVISGYLLYPYPQLDFFSVDWKMPASIVTYDAREIMVWGRNLKDVSLYDMPIWEWFPVWFENVPHFIVVIGLISAFALGIYTLYDFLVKRKQDIRLILLFVYSILALVVWLFSAPLIRYGEVYLFMPVCGIIWTILKYKKNNERLQCGVKNILTLLIIPVICIYISSWRNLGSLPKKMQENYRWIETDFVELDDGIKIWHPVSGDQGSYDVFPCVPYMGMVKKVEIRGDGLEDGFRVKEEYRDRHLNGYGSEW